MTFVGEISAVGIYVCTSRVFVLPCYHSSESLLYKNRFLHKSVEQHVSQIQVVFCKEQFGGNNSMGPVTFVLEISAVS